MMVQFKLALHNLIKNKEQSIPFILSNSMWIAITYIFLSMIYNTNIKATNGGGPTNYILKTGLVFVILIAALSTFYAERLLNKQRTQELGLYSILGLTKRHLRQIVLFENGLFYIICTVIGGTAGVLFSKLAFMSLKTLLGETTGLHQHFTLTPIMYVALIFVIIFLLLILSDFWELRKVSPINLWAKSEQPEKEPKAHFLLAVLGIGILAGGYYISVTVKPTSTAFVQFVIAIMLVVIGSYLVFITASVSLLKILKKHKHYYYKPNHFISVSNLLYRMKLNGAGLASISLLCSAILVALIGSVSLVTGQKNLIDLFSPRDVQIVAQAPLSAAEKQVIHKAAHDYHITISDPQNVTVTTPVMGTLSGNQFKTQMNAKTEYTLASLDLKQYNQLQRTHYQLNKDEVLIYTPGSHYSQKQLKIQGKSYQVRTVHNFNGSFSYGHSIYKSIFVIAANSKIAKQINPHPNVYAQGFNTHGTQKHQKQFANTVQKKLKVEPSNFTSKEVLGDLFKSLFGSLLFMGTLISIVMICATTMIIYYKQVSEGYADRSNYQIMRKVGLSRKETNRAIKSQVLTVFLLPIVGAVINLIFALPGIKSVLSNFSMYDLNILIIVSILVTAILMVIYLIIYLATTTVYQHIVNQVMS